MTGEHYGMKCVLEITDCGIGCMAGSCFDYCSRKVTRPGTIGIRKVVRDEGTFEN